MKQGLTAIKQAETELKAASFRCGTGHFGLKTGSCSGRQELAGFKQEFLAVKQVLSIWKQLYPASGRMSPQRVRTSQKSEKRWSCWRKRPCRWKQPWRTTTNPRLQAVQESQKAMQAVWMHSTVWTKSWRKYIASWMSSGQSDQSPILKKKPANTVLSASAVKVFAGFYSMKALKMQIDRLSNTEKPMKSNRGHGRKRLTTFISKIPNGITITADVDVASMQDAARGGQYFSPPFTFSLLGVQPACQFAAFACAEYGQSK